MIIKDPHLTKSDAEEQFANWLTTQRNANGKVFKQTVANSYARNLRTEPPKIDMPLSLSERDIYSCRTVAAFDALNHTIQSAPNFREVNRSANHGAFSAGLAAYRRYVQYIEENGEPEMHEQETSAGSAETSIDISPASSAEPQRVDFSNPQECKRTDLMRSNPSHQDSGLPRYDAPNEVLTSIPRTPHGTIASP